MGPPAREALRRIEAVRVTAGGSLVEPVTLAHGGTLAIVLNGVNHTLLGEHYLDASVPDNRIIGAALSLKLGGVDVEVVSNDAALRIKAAHVGLAAKEYVPVPAYGRDLGSPGWRTLGGLDGALVDRLFAERRVDAADVAGAEGVHENEFAVLRAGQQSALARRKGDHLWLLRSNQEAFDLKPRNIEQRLALDLLLDPEVSVVALDGPGFSPGRPRAPRWCSPATPPRSTHRSCRPRTTPWRCSPPPWVADGAVGTSATSASPRASAARWPRWRPPCSRSVLIYGSAAWRPSG